MRCGQPFQERFYGLEWQIRYLHSSLLQELQRHCLLAVRGKKKAFNLKCKAVDFFVCFFF